jgi:hypothetical protein
VFFLVLCPVGFKTFLLTESTHGQAKLLARRALHRGSVSSTTLAGGHCCEPIMLQLKRKKPNVFPGAADIFKLTAIRFNVFIVLPCLDN